MKFSGALSPEHERINRVHVGVVHGALGRELHEWRTPQVADFVRIKGSGRYAPGQTEAGAMADMRRELHLGRDITGVVITSVDDGSAADALGLTRGDVVLAINQQPVGTPQEAAQKLKEAASSPRKSALLLLNRHGVTQYVGLDLGKNEG